MAVTVTRTSSNLTGTPTSLATVGAGGNNLPLTALSLMGAGVIEATIITEIVVTTTSAANITITYFVSQDGTNYLQDGPAIAFTPTASTTYWYTYYPPDSAQSVQVRIDNATTVAITAMVQGSTLAVS